MRRRGGGWGEEAGRGGALYVHRQSTLSPSRDLSQIAAANALGSLARLRAHGGPAAAAGDDEGLAALVERALDGPDLSPAGVVNLAAAAGRLGVPLAAAALARLAAAAAAAAPRLGARDAATLLLALVSLPAGLPGRAGLVQAACARGVATLPQVAPAGRRPAAEGGGGGGCKQNGARPGLDGAG